MPITPAFKKFYGSAWRTYRADLIRLRGARCSVCGADVPKYLNLCHLTHDPRSSEVALMCPRDHRRHDARHSRAIARRTLARRYGQFWLTPELEWAPLPLWMAPRRLVLVPRPEQGRLWAA
jgi:hypothetical protein